MGRLSTPVERMLLFVCAAARVAGSELLIPAAEPAPVLAYAAKRRAPRPKGRKRVTSREPVPVDEKPAGIRFLVGMGQDLADEAFGRLVPGQEPPAVLVNVVANPEDADAVTALRRALREKLVTDPGMRETVRRKVTPASINISAPGRSLRARWGMRIIVVASVLTALLTFLANASVALYIGVFDAFRPVTLSAQIVGVFFLIAAVLSLSGTWAMFQLGRKIFYLWRLKAARGIDRYFMNALVRDTSIRLVAVAGAAALAGLYIDVTILLYAQHYIVGYSYLSGALALICLALAVGALRATWKFISRGLKATGLTLAALGALSQFWYQSVYVPGQTASGIEYAITTNSKTGSGSDRLAQLNLTFQDAGSVPLVVLASVIKMQEMDGLPTTNQTPKTASHGSEPSECTRTGQPVNLTPDQPIKSGSFLFPDETYSLSFTVRIPCNWLNELQITFRVYYARASWLALGGTFTPAKAQNSKFSCSTHTQQTIWYIRKSALRNFTQGTQVAYSDWCPDSAALVYANIAGLKGGQLTETHAEVAPGSDLGILRSSRYTRILLSP